MQFLSAEHYNPVLLEITEVNHEEGKGVCVNIYVGFKSNQKIYAKLVTDPQGSPDFPEYIRVRKGKTTGFENYTELVSVNSTVVPVMVKELEHNEGINLGKQKGVKSFTSDDIAIGIINKIWTDQLIRNALNRNFMLRAV